MRGGAPKEIPLFLTSKTEIAKLSKEEIAKLQFLQFQPLKNAYFTAFRREIA